MRSFLWVLLLGLLGGGLLLWLASSEESDESDQALEQGADPTEGGSGLLKAEAVAMIVIEPPGAWPEYLVEDGRVFGDPRAVDEVFVKSPTGEEFHLSGAALLQILEGELKDTGIQFRFESEDALERFKKFTPKALMPVVAPLRLVLEQFMSSGYAFVSYAGKAYVTPITPQTHPGAGERVPPPIEGVEPERR
jgi:hypothetical protein